MSQDVDKHGASDGFTREAGLRVRRPPPAAQYAVTSAHGNEPIEISMWRCPWCCFLSPIRAIVKEHMTTRPHTGSGVALEPGTAPKE